MVEEADLVEMLVKMAAINSGLHSHGMECSPERVLIAIAEPFQYEKITLPTEKKLSTRCMTVFIVLPWIPKSLFTSPINRHAINQYNAKS